MCTNALALIVLWLTYVTSDVRTKRLVLHSPDDMAAEIVQLKADVQNLTYAVQAQAREIEQLKTVPGSGSSYTRWGRSNCPGNGSDVAYKGYMAGTYFDHSSWAYDADGANYICLPENPSWDHTVSSMDNGIGVTGVVYIFTPFHKSTTQFFGSEISGGQAPCAVCHVKRGTNIMIPGRTDCYPGWTKEYGGYLVTSYAGYDDATEYVCLDRRPEMVPNSASSEKQNSLFFVESQCHGLECPPYVDGLELACVVCSV